MICLKLSFKISFYEQHIHALTKQTHLEAFTKAFLMIFVYFDLCIIVVFAKDMVDNTQLAHT